LYAKTVLIDEVENDKVAGIKNDFDIKLEVIESEGKRVLAVTKITITNENMFYSIKE
jgi:hypothetical protein